MKHFTITYKYTDWVSHSFYAWLSPEDALESFPNKDNIISVEETKPELMKEMLDVIKIKSDDIKESLIYEWRLKDFITI